MTTKIWTPERLALLEKHYSVLPKEQLAEMFGSTWRNLIKVAYKHNIKSTRRASGIGCSRKYTVDEKFFAKWSDQMAYVLGWVFADGHLRYKGNKPIGLCFTLADEQVLLNMRSLMKATHRVHPAAHQPSTAVRTIHQFEINNIRLVRPLGRKFKIPTNKAEQGLPFPKVPEQYIRHFVRGYFEGNGSIVIVRPPGSEQQETLSLSIVAGHFEFMQALRQCLIDHGLSANVKLYAAPSGKKWSVSYGLSDAYQFYYWIYKNVPAEELLERKKLKFEQVFKQRGWSALEPGTRRSRRPFRFSRFTKQAKLDNTTSVEGKP